MLAVQNVKNKTMKMKLIYFLPIFYYWHIEERKQNRTKKNDNSESLANVLNNSHWWIYHIADNLIE